MQHVYLEELILNKKLDVSSFFCYILTDVNSYEKVNFKIINTFWLNDILDNSIAYLYLLCQ